MCVPSAKFRDVLHEAIQTGLREGVDEVQINSAKQTQHGWMHIHGEDEYYTSQTSISETDGFNTNRYDMIFGIKS